ncbi:hypothetical protein A3E46_02510 [Candidatus Woesebacteria bacterium RIFCSPHIGHO2_12_FULL_46_16]|uniref:N-acetyltransferase domain-containing protein n=1 Tax=Candidatus Woesebacteria bacterium RIFCSPHIGHO2_12_FULL_46_16 TaxID=1802513 RepID=A0A1F8AYU8_9BACT|nr:MAG: hypothetical protein A3E46_02510 [Candidatus Woesebacteria bacterium RIFCSPHIGHO2_12_FULL_46_16]
MSDKEKVIDFKKHEGFIEQYVDLRNSYAELLLTAPVNIPDTKEWLKRNDIEVRGILHDDILLGVVILYLNRGGEIAFFVKEKDQGVGSKLLKIAEKVANERELKSLWAWVLVGNFIAQRVFEKNGFLKEGISERQYKSVIKQGYTYKKYLNY